MRIFIIGGKAGSGKSVAAKIIKDYYDKLNNKSIITEYSKYLKLYAKEILGWNYDEPKPRKFLQDLGLYIRKSIDNDFLINRIKQDLLVYEKYYDTVIISDARFIEEFENIKNAYEKVYTIHLVNNNDNNLSEEEKNHISEITLDKYSNFDYNIQINDIQEINKKIVKILEEIK